MPAINKNRCKDKSHLRGHGEFVLVHGGPAYGEVGATWVEGIVYTVWKSLDFYLWDNEEPAYPSDSQLQAKE